MSLLRNYAHVLEKEYPETRKFAIDAIPAMETAEVHPANSENADIVEQLRRETIDGVQQLFDMRNKPALFRQRIFPKGLTTTLYLSDTRRIDLFESGEKTAFTLVETRSTQEEAIRDPRLLANDMPLMQFWFDKNKPQNATSAMVNPEVFRRNAAAEQMKIPTGRLQAVLGVTGQLVASVREKARTLLGRQPEDLRGIEVDMMHLIALDAMKDAIAGENGINSNESLVWQLPAAAKKIFMKSLDTLMDVNRPDRFQFFGIKVTPQKGDPYVASMLNLQSDHCVVVKERRDNYATIGIYRGHYDLNRFPHSAPEMELKVNLTRIPPTCIVSEMVMSFSASSVAMPATHPLRT